MGVTIDFRDGWHHRTVGAVHQAVEQAKQHEQHRSQRGFDRQGEVICHKLCGGNEGNRHGGVQDKRAEFAFFADVAPGIKQLLQRYARTFFR